MLNPRIYRAAFLPVFVAVVLLAFSFHNEPGPLGTNLAPAAFNGQAAFNKLTNLAQHYPNRRPGSPGDNGIADQVASSLSAYKTFTVRRSAFSAHTVDGTRTIQTVIGELPGSSTGRIVVITHRD